MYVLPDDLKNINKQLMYTACSRARKNYEIIFDQENEIEDSKSTNEKMFFHNCKRIHGSISKTKFQRLEEIRGFFTEHKDRYDFNSIDECYKAYAEYEINVRDNLTPIKKRQFYYDFDFLYPNHKFPKKTIDNSVRTKRTAEQRLKSCAKLFVLDLKNRHISRTLLAQSKSLNNSIVNGQNCTIPGSNSTTIYSNGKCAGES
jgi:hypothetical protein